MPGGVDEGARAGRRVTLAGGAANLLLAGLKLAAGLLGNSQALVADAAHSLSDLLSDVMVLVGLALGRRAPDADHHFGHARMETLATAALGVSLLAVAAFIGYEAARDIYTQVDRHPTWLALAGAGVSVVVKEALYQRTIRVGRRIGSEAVVANAWHHRTDALSSVAVVLGVGAAQLDPSLGVLDAYAAGLVSFFVVKVGVDVLRRAARELTDAAPRPDVLDGMVAGARAVPGVADIHDLKVRSAGGRYWTQIHVDVDGALTVTEGHAIAKAVEDRLKREFPRTQDVLVHVDPAGEEEGG